MTDPIGIRKYDYIEFYVGSAKMVAYWYAKGLGLDITAYAGPETGVYDRTSYYLTGNDLKFVITSGLQPTTYDCWGFITHHGDGVKRWAIEVDDVEAAYAYATSHTGISARRPEKLSDENGFVMEAAIKLYDDTELVYINYDNYKGKFKPGFGESVLEIEVSRKDTGIIAIDHIVGNVRENEMNHWATYFNKTMGFETFIDFKPGDIGTQYSALLSKVVKSAGFKIRNPINEPFEGKKKSQIQEYIEQYYGSGVQHIAIRTEDIIKTISALRANGIEFLNVPDTYYEAMRKRKDLGLEEDLNSLEKLGILFDKESNGYLLQLFTKPTGDRPTFFFEFIQRHGDSQGFGKGNFQALFEAIERDQGLRGNL